MELYRFTRRAWDDIPNLLSLLAFFCVTWLLFRSLEFALVVTASLGFHELGHAAALAWYGLDWRITFGVVGAWTWSPLPDRERLSQFANVMIHLGGPLFSLLLALLALGVQAAWQPGDRHLLTLASFSAQVGLFNLLPMGPLTDGGKVVRRMIASLNLTRQKQMAVLPVLVTAFMLAMYGLIEAPHISRAESMPFFLGLLLVGAWMAGSMLIESQWAALSSPPVHTNGSPMTTGQVAFFLFVLWDFLVLGLILTAATPFWLAPEYVLGSLSNMAAILHLLQRLAL